MMYSDFNYATPQRTERPHFDTYSVVTPEEIVRPSRHHTVIEEDMSFLDSIIQNLNFIDYNDTDEEDDRQVDLFERLDAIRTPLYAPVFMPEEYMSEPVTKNIVFNQCESIGEQVEECPICLTNQTNCITGCNHKFCMGCVEQHIRSCERKAETACPMCRGNITEVFHL